VRTDLQIGIDCRRRPKPEVRVLTVAERASTTFSCIVRRLPCRIAQECAQPREVLGVQVLQLPAQRRQCGRFGVSLPGVVALLSVSWSASLSAVVFPDTEPRLKERTGHTKFTSDRPSQQFVERLTLFDGEVLGLMGGRACGGVVSLRARRTSSQSRHGGGGGSGAGFISAEADNSPTTTGSGSISLSHLRIVS